jgi:hypothetical protein
MFARAEQEYMHLIGMVTSSLGYLRSLDCNFRSPLMKTLDWSVETLGLGYNSTFRVGFAIIYLNQSSERNMIQN